MGAIAQESHKVLPHTMEPKMFKMSSLGLVFAMVLKLDQNQIF